MSVCGLWSFWGTGCYCTIYATSSEAQVHYMVGDAEIRYIL